MSPCEDSHPITSPCSSSVSPPHPQLGTGAGLGGQEGSKTPQSMQNHLPLCLLLSQKLMIITGHTNTHGKHGWDRPGAGTRPHATSMPPGSTLGARRRTPHCPTHPQVKYHLGFAVADKLMGILGVKNDKILKLKGESCINAKPSDVPCFILSCKTSAFIQAHQTERSGPRSTQHSPGAQIQASALCCTQGSRWKTSTSRHKLSVTRGETRRRLWLPESSRQAPSSSFRGWGGYKGLEQDKHSIA